MAAHGTELAPGTVVGSQYDVRRLVGRGATAVVYAARPLGEPDEVALKVLAPDEAHPEALRRRFWDELVVGTRLRHPNVVEVRDFGVLDETGAPYLVMELLRGRDLRFALGDRARFDDRRVLRLFLGVAEALAAGHALGIVHKDLKPSNLFLRRRDGEEELVVLDFGISHLGGRAEEPGWTVITPRYASPEYALRQEVRPGLDVYQVGLVMAEVLGGHPVVAAPTPREALAAHARGRLELDPVVLRSRLYPVIRKALEPDPERRYADGRALLAALRELAEADRPEGGRLTVRVIPARLADDPELSDPGSMEPPLSAAAAPSGRAVVAWAVVAAVVAGGAVVAAALALGWALA